MRKVTDYDLREFHEWAGNIPVRGEDGVWVSISSEDRKNGSPKIGDMIARNPKNHKDQWLIAAQYFYDNFEPI